MTGGQQMAAGRNDHSAAAAELAGRRWVLRSCITLPVLGQTQRSQNAASAAVSGLDNDGRRDTRMRCVMVPGVPLPNGRPPQAFNLLKAADLAVAECTWCFALRRAEPRPCTGGRCISFFVEAFGSSHLMSHSRSTQSMATKRARLTIGFHFFCNKV